MYRADLGHPLQIDGEIVCAVGFTGTYVALDGLEEKYLAWKAKQNKPQRAPRKKKSAPA